MPTAPLKSVSIPDGKADVFILKNTRGIEATITNYGGILMSLKTPDRNGLCENIVLGFDSPAAYCTDSYLIENPYLGAIVGRNANVIRNGRFSIEGLDISLQKNFGKHNLHGGIKGFDKYIWSCSQRNNEHAQSVELFRESPDGEEGFPGNAAVWVTYELNNDNEFIIRTRAKADQATILNPTYHSYFNLGACGDILDHILKIDSASYIEFDKELVPTGLIKQVDQTPMDLRIDTKIGEVLQVDFDQLTFAEGYDVTYVLAERETLKTPAATLWHPRSGRFMELFTTLPGLHLYTGNSLNENIKKECKPRAALCLEAQYYPDGPNHLHFKSGLFQADKWYDHATVYRFSVK